MGILDNFENAWDGYPAESFENLSTKLFSETVCSECYSKPSPIVEGIDKEAFWQDLGRPTNKDHTALVEQAIKENKAVRLKGLIPQDKLPDWQEFIDHLAYGTKENDEEYVNKLFQKPIIGIAHFWGDLTIVVAKNLDEYFKHYDHYKDTLLDIYNGELFDHGSVVSFSDIDAGATTKHHDDGDVFNLQCIGKVKWEIWDEKEYSERPPDQVFYQEPGDVIFVPAYLWHRVTSLTPRASLLFGFNPKR